MLAHMLRGGGGRRDEVQLSKEQDRLCQKNAAKAREVEIDGADVSANLNRDYVFQILLLCLSFFFSYVTLSVCLSVSGSLLLKKHI